MLLACLAVEHKGVDQHPLRYDDGSFSDMASTSVRRDVQSATQGRFRCKHLLITIKTIKRSSTAKVSSFFRISNDVVVVEVALGVNNKVEWRYNTNYST